MTDEKKCVGCGDWFPIGAFLVWKLNDSRETEYCCECRVGCDVCGDYIVACGGCEAEQDNTPDNMYTLGLEPRGRAA